jgi:hypothetical protein
MKKPSYFIPMAAFVCCVLSGSAQAALIAYEGFDYTASTSLASAAGGTGFTAGSWGTGPSFPNGGSWTVGTVGLTYGALQTSGLTATGLGGATAIGRNLAASSGGPASSVWISFLVSNMGNNLTGISLFDGNTEGTFSGRIGSLQTTFYGGAGNPVATQQTFGTGTNDLNTHMYVINFDATGANPVINAWIDPDFSSLGVGSSPTGGLSTSITSAQGAQIYDFNAVRLGLFSGVGSQTGNFDEIRVGQTWADVSPVAIPEPSAALLGGVGILALLRRRRNLV